MTAEERQQLTELLKAQREAIAEAGNVKIDPNRQFADDPKVDEDVQPLNEMNQVIASSASARCGDQMTTRSDASPTGTLPTR